jgi:hypothetical protein
VKDKSIHVAYKCNQSDSINPIMQPRSKKSIEKHEALDMLQIAHCIDNANR